MIDVLVVGGGPMVEALRQLDSVHHFTPEAAHWLSIRAMSVTAGLVAELLSEAKLISWLKDVGKHADTHLQVVDVEPFLRAEANSAHALPCSWDVTSDSIAARVATVLEARELVLLKSRIPDGSGDRENWSRTGFVDRHFSIASQGLNVRAVNLRDAGYPQVQ